MDGPAIYGLEFQARALAALASESSDADTTEFLVGTQTIKSDTNQVHHLLFNDEEETLSSVIHPFGHEISSMMACPTAEHSRLFVTCGNTGKRKLTELYSLPSEQATEPLEPVLEFDLSGNPLGMCWHPSQAEKAAFLTDTGISVTDFDAGGGTSRMTTEFTIESKQTFGVCRWSPHYNCSFIAASDGPNLVGWDLRNNKESFTIKHAHPHTRTLDFNPNKQHYLVTGGDDGCVKFWDSRNPSEPLLQFRNHTHWVWAVRYNTFHDQLVLSSSSDSQVILSNAASLSSDIYGGLDDDSGDEAESSQQTPLPDGMAVCFDEHEDSVYGLEWSATDPWIFASLSYDGRLLINKVPDNIKFRILCL